MQHKQLQFGAQKMLAPGDTEGLIMPRGADQWLYVIAGSGTVLDKRSYVMTTPKEKVITSLKSLYESSKDCENGYRLAAEQAKDAALKSIFHDLSTRRAQLAGALQVELARLGQHDEKTGTIAGALHQGWAAIKASAVSRSDPILIDECIRGEEEAWKACEEALRHLAVDETKVMIRHHVTEIEQSLDRLRKLEAASKPDSR